MATKSIVLIAVDDKRHSENAFKWYIAHSKQKDDYIVIFHAYEHLAVSTVTYPTILPTGEYKSMLENHKLKIRMLEDNYRKMLEDNNIEGEIVAVEEKHPAYAICEYAKNKNVAHIVMGRRGLGAIRRTLQGSVSDYVTHHSSVPVTIVPQKKTK